MKKSIAENGKNLFGEKIDSNDEIMKRRKNFKERKKTQEVRVNENTTVKIYDLKEVGELCEETIVSLAINFEDNKKSYVTDFCFGMSFFSVSRRIIKKILLDAVLKASDYCPKTSDDKGQLNVFRRKVMDQFDVDLDGAIIYIRNPQESSKLVTHRFEDGYTYFDLGTGYGVKILKRNKHSVVFSFYEICEDGTIFQGNPKDAHEIGICGDGEVLSDGPIESGLFNVRAEKSIVADNVVWLNTQ